MTLLTRRVALWLRVEANRLPALGGDVVGPRVTQTWKVL